eukprot:3788912-Lingulodinium_polyedra.AAC.1
MALRAPTSSNGRCVGAGWLFCGSMFVEAARVWFSILFRETLVRRRTRGEVPPGISDVDGG